MDALTILYQDEWLVAFDKPAGLLVAPDRWDKAKENLVRLAQARLSPAIFNAHRLDRETSGVLLCAKGRDVLRELCRRFERHEVEKEYLALVRNGPAAREGAIRHPLGEDPRHPGRMCVAESGRPAETRYEVVERWAGYSLLRLRPLTGRTHQLRVHLAAIECPIVGDAFYGAARVDGAELPIGRLALHAEVLAFEHPVTRVPLEIIAPLPPDFDAAVRYLDRHAR